MKDFTVLIDELTASAREANAREQRFRQEAAKQAAALSEERAFAFRRVNLLRAIAKAVAEAKTEEEAQAAARPTFLREVGWNGAIQLHRDVGDRFMPVALAVWAATRPEGAEDASAVERELAAFEAWYAAERNAPFLTLMEREIVELPLVEV